MPTDNPADKPKTYHACKGVPIAHIRELHRIDSNHPIAWVSSCPCPALPEGCVVVQKKHLRTLLYAERAWVGKEAEAFDYLEAVLGGKL